jgi:hypothetical protein
MTALRPDLTEVLTLAEQLDAMLLGWLERQSLSLRADAQAVAVLIVASRHIPDVETFCAGWGMTVERLGGNAIRVTGPRLPVVGFTEITAMYRP